MCWHIFQLTISDSLTKNLWKLDTTVERLMKRRVKLICHANSPGYLKNNILNYIHLYIHCSLYNLTYHNGLSLLIFILMYILKVERKQIVPRQNKLEKKNQNKKS